jgi:protoporphyrin/coproporphyrin ferrochelatase
LERKAVLLMAYGSPDTKEDVEAYYTHIRGGRKPTKEELENLKSRYERIGGQSPLLKVTKSTAKKLEQKLNSREKVIEVYSGMKHWHPFIAETFDEISKDGISQLTSVALAPHYSKMSIGSYQDAVKKANEEHGNKIILKFVDNWHLDSVFIEKWKERINDAYKLKFSGTDREHIFFLFTAHSLPEKIQTWNDPYKIQLLETTEKLATELKLEEKQYGFAFQSAGHTSELWLGPDILEKVKELKMAGWKNILVAPIGFVSDHLEILFDIDIETKDLAKDIGIHLERTESFNDSDDFIDVLESVVRQT